MGQHVQEGKAATPDVGKRAQRDTHKIRRVEEAWSGTECGHGVT